MANLEAAFGERYTERERTRIGRESVRGFAATMLELFWLAGRPALSWKDFVEDDGEEEIGRHLESDQGVIFVLQHVGNWEVANFVAGWRGQGTRVIAQEFKNPLLGPVFDHAREASGNEVLGRQRVMVRILKHLGRGGAVAMLADLTLPPDQPTVVIECFGLQTCVTSMHVELAKRLGCVLVPVTGLRQPSGRIRIQVGAPVDSAGSIREVAQACWDVAERAIREQPELWLWSYKHWRYLPAERQREYPFYANLSGAFEKRLAGKI